MKEIAVLPGIAARSVMIGVRPAIRAIKASVPEKPMAGTLENGCEGVRLSRIGTELKKMEIISHPKNGLE